MEDYMVIYHNISSDKNSSAFCVFDGHNGMEVPQICIEKMPLALERVLRESKTEEQFKDKLIRAFEITNGCLN